MDESERCALMKKAHFTRWHTHNLFPLCPILPPIHPPRLGATLPASDLASSPSEFNSTASPRERASLPAPQITFEEQKGSAPVYRDPWDGADWLREDSLIETGSCHWPPDQLGGQGWERGGEGRGVVYYSGAVWKGGGGYSEGKAAYADNAPTLRFSFFGGFMAIIFFIRITAKLEFKSE